MSPPAPQPLHDDTAPSSTPDHGLPVFFELRGRVKQLAEVTSVHTQRLEDHERRISGLDGRVDKALSQSSTALDMVNRLQDKVAELIFMMARNAEQMSQQNAILSRIEGRTNAIESGLGGLHEAEAVRKRCEADAVDGKKRADEWIRFAVGTGITVLMSLVALIWWLATHISK